VCSSDLPAKPWRQGVADLADWLIAERGLAIEAAPRLAAGAL
jgi:hypothetical protein